MLDRSPARFVHLAPALAACAALVALGCAAPAPYGTSKKAGKTAGAAPDAEPSGTFGDQSETPQAPADGTGQIAEVYGHSASTLYKLDPLTKAVTVVGAFRGCAGVTDIALDETSRLLAVTDGALYSVDRATAACTLLASGSYPNSLSFVPKGTIDPNAETLVGYEEGDYVRIDPSSGQKTRIGSLGGGFASSGDIVSVKGGPTYLTVVGPGCGDCLVEVDPKTGALVKNLGTVAHRDVYGLAFWAGRLYGFDDAGQLFEVTVQATSVTTVPIAVPNAPAGLSFWGAGSTTSAPVTGPR